jgi:DNA-binding LytR/AlgR family response regulator
MNNNSIYIPNKNRYERIYKTDILLMEAQGVYVDVLMLDKKKYRVSTSLISFLSQLNEKDMFTRISRKFAININHITVYQKGKVWLNENEMIVNKEFRRELEQKLLIIRTKKILKSEYLKEEGGHLKEIDMALEESDF